MWSQEQMDKHPVCDVVKSIKNSDELSMKGLTKNACLYIYTRRKIKSVHSSPKGRGGNVEIREINGDCWSLMALKGKKRV